MKLHTKKMIAPIFITLVTVLYYVGFALACIFIEEFPLILKIFAGALPLVFVGICVYVLIERIKEIRSGIEDDLSKY